mgnify:CR=1 FL=1
MTAAAQKRNQGTGAPNPARKALSSASVGFWAILITSVFTNLLLLVSPIFMLQVYDRVLGSRSEETLVALSLLVVFVLQLFAQVGLNCLNFLCAFDALCYYPPITDMTIVMIF